MSEETVTFNLEINIEPTYGNVRRLEAMAMRALSHLEKAGVVTDEQTKRKINELQTIITLARMAQIVYRTAMLGTPLGWAYAGMMTLSMAELVASS